MLQDQEQRVRATDPTQSFIVQAPAGSGKTEILSQRFLRLLSVVHEPEQILALTFTRKAANEMRERILHALQRAAHGIEAQSAHQALTNRYASEALTRDKIRQWNILQQPNRLRINTIDSLCQSLNSSIPCFEQHIPYATIGENSQALYQEAAHACLSYAIASNDYQEALCILLKHLDNRQDILLALFSQLLTQREQWLPILYSANIKQKKHHEKALAWIEQHELQRFKNTLSREQADELMRLIRQLLSITSNEFNQTIDLINWKSMDELNTTLAAQLASLLLTSQNALRQSFDHHVGLKRGICSDEDYQRIKNESKILLFTLRQQPDFIESLRRLKSLPEPQYDASQWNVLQALFRLLPLLAAQLTVVFQQNNEIDFIAIAQQALQGLGSEDNPTDLALYLDHQIQHLLIDEFQDTSIQQFQLLTQLVQGWQAHEGKSVFIVGDPMQSIYRFRAAEVGLFLRAKQYGLGPVPLTPLELSCNFRSSSAIVEWVNQQFRSIFPQLDDIESGAVCFHPSTVVNSHSTDSCIDAFSCNDMETEANAIVQRIKSELTQYPSDNIAILVRSRNQLRRIIRALRIEKIPFQGIDIDLLANLPHLRDVWSFTQALLMPAHRLAWLALLRSPYCGLSLHDLHLVANYDKKKSIYFALSQLNQISNLSVDGRIRARFFYNIMHNALLNRHQKALTDWLIDTLNQLHFDSILSEYEQRDLEQYWILLNQFQQDGLIYDWVTFKNEFNKLYSQQVVPAQLKVMTIHKSKGLEFDCVILPGLGSTPKEMNRPLLRWLKIPTQKNDELLLVSPIKAAHQEHDTLYQYLGELDKEKNHYERQRQLYVAVTRARKRLYLFDNQLKALTGSFRGMLRHVNFITLDPSLDSTTRIESLPNLHRLPINLYKKDLLNFSSSSASHPIFDTNNHQQRLIGICTHALLKWIADHHPTIQEIPWELAHYQLKQYGFTGASLEQANQLIQQQVTQLFADPRGQWIMQKHLAERNEYELMYNESGNFITRIIDRTFIAEQIRWIIDFKTGAHTNQNEHQYRQQLTEYARLLNHDNDYPIHCGIYYLVGNRWLAWDFSKYSSPEVVSQ